MQAQEERTHSGTSKVRGFRWSRRYPIRDTTSRCDQAATHRPCDTVAGMIREHHKVRRFKGGDAGFIESFRRADWIDVSLGVLSFGLPRERLRKILAHWANCGFYKRVAQLMFKRWRTQPLSPVPVLTW